MTGRMLRKRSQLFFLLFQVLFLASVLGGYANWFREGMDLVTTLLMVCFFIAALVVLLPVHVFCFIRGLMKRFGRLDVALLYVSTVIFVAIVVVPNVVLLGRLYPSLEGRVFRDQTRTFVDNDGHVINWYAEFANPYLASHKERLILIDGKQKKVVKTQLLANEKIFGRTGSDRIFLKQIGSNILLESTIEISPTTRFVLIDYKSGTVISNWLEQTVWAKPKQAEPAP